MLGKLLGGHYKVWGFLSSGLLSCDANLLCMQHPPGPFHVVPVELREQREPKET